MKKYIVPLLILVLTVSCSTPLNFQVSKPGEDAGEYTGRVVYSLPRTLVRINLSIEKESFIPGPYYQFTERLLGLSDYISEYGFQYRISSVNIETFTEPDPDMFYSVNIMKGNFDWEKYLLLSEKGFVMDPSAAANYSTYSGSGEAVSALPYFRDMSTRMNLEEVTDTLYKTVITDTTMIRLPVVTTAREVRTIEQKAEEAAANLFTIRENRFFLITNTEGEYPDGKALDVMVREMDKMEKAYVELFTGKVIKQKFSRSFVYLPENDDETEISQLAGFSTTSGIGPVEQGIPLRLEITPLNNFRNLEGVSDFNYKGEPITNLLYYRIPDAAIIKVLLMDEVLYEGRINVYQFGGLINVPVKE